MSIFGLENLRCGWTDRVRRADAGGNCVNVSDGKCNRTTILYTLGMCPRRLLSRYPEEELQPSGLDHPVLNYRGFDRQYQRR